MINAKDIKKAITDPLRAMIDYGVPEELLTPKGSACPVCGDGDDRFSYDRNKYNGERVFCRVCGSLDYLDVIQQVNNWDFKTLIDELADYAGLSKLDSTQRESLQEQRAIAEEREKQRLKTEYLKAILLTDLHNLFRDTVVIEQLEIAENVIRTVDAKIRRKVEQSGSYIKHKEFIKYYGLCKFNGWTETIQYIKCCKYLSSEPTDEAFIRDAVNIILLNDSFGGVMEYRSDWLKRYFSYYTNILKGSV